MRLDENLQFAESDLDCIFKINVFNLLNAPSAEIGRIGLWRAKNNKYVLHVQEKQGEKSKNKLWASARCAECGVYSKREEVETCSLQPIY
jgi:hypothetical protein